MPFGFGAEFCRQWARVSLWAFYKDVKIEHYDDLDTKDTPVIFAITHHNMLLDPAVICHACSKNYLHYWAKCEIFINDYVNKFLNSVGCVPVDRKSKDYKQLYQATFDVLELNESLAIFPEGTSHTLPYLGKLKEGASFVALEYAELLQNTSRVNKYGMRPKPAVIVPVGITYTDKSKYRSSVIVKFGEPIDVVPYLPEFKKNPKATAKQITKRIEDTLIQLTINAPNWYIQNAAIMARDILFPTPSEIPNFVQVTQRLIDKFSKDTTFVDTLNEYRQELTYLSLRHTDLDDYDYESKTLTFTIGKRFSIQSFFMLLDLIIYSPVLLAHAPLYMVSSYIASHEIYEEALAQDKIIYATLAFPPVVFCVWMWVWTHLYPFNFVGFVLSIATVLVLFWLHVATIDERYERFKQWRGSFHLFDAFVLHRGYGRLKKRILHALKLRHLLSPESLIQK